MWARFPLRLKIMLLVMLVVGTAGSVYGQVTYKGLDSVLTDSSAVGAQTAALALANMIDPKWIRDFRASSHLDTPEYRELSDIVHKLVESRSLIVATVVRTDRQNEMVEILIDLPESDPYASPPGSQLSLHSSFIYPKTSAGYTTVGNTGSHLKMAAWAPIQHHEQLVGMVVVLTDLTKVEDALGTIAASIIGVIVLIIALSGAVSYKFAITFEKTAVTDGLMGIYNHKYFKQRLEEEVAKAKRYGQATSMVLFDIDFFKRVNDTYGHATGDLVLKLMAKWVMDLCRNTDVVCRYGGEEIACILPHTGIAGAQEFAERLRLKISQQVVKDPEEDAEFRVTVSVGVVQWQKGMEMMDMIKGADAALYNSKRTGRNRVTLYHEELLPAPEEMASKPERTKGRR